MFKVIALAAAFAATASVAGAQSTSTAAQSTVKTGTVKTGVKASTGAKRHSKKVESQAEKGCCS